MTDKQNDDNEQGSKSTRDLIREKTLGKGRTLQSTKYKVEGVEVELRQPTVGERNEIRDLACNDDGTLNQLNLIVWAVIRLTMTPDDHQRVFEDTDYHEFMNQPTNSWVDELGEALLEMLNVSQEEQGKG